MMSASAVAQDDYSISNRSWNGVSELIEIANAAGVTIDTPAELDVEDLQQGDSLLVIYPNESLPAASLTRFIRAGGRVAVADDFGQGSEFFEVFGIRRGAPAPDRAPRLRENPALLISRARQRHPLTVDAETLVTNHPSSLYHAELTALYGFGDTSDAVVLTGAVESGRLVAISDPSILINNMVRFRSNRTFATNLISYLATDGGRLFIITPESRLMSSREGSAGARRRLNEHLESIARAELPPAAVVLASLLLLTLFGLFAASTLPSAPTSRAHSIATRYEGGGFAGRVAFSVRRKKQLVHSCLVYKFELESALSEALALPTGANVGDVVARLRQRGVREADASALRALLVELAELRVRVDLPPGLPRIRPRELHRMVETGERVLAQLATRPT